jgi:hypothetical protein
MPDDVIDALDGRLPPGNSLPVRFSSCTGPANPPQTFDTEGPYHGAADTWLLTDGSKRTYVLKYAVYTDPPRDVLHAMPPGFNRTGRDVVTCHVMHDGRDVTVLGILTPGRGN